jgi:murein DD-endopeptidase MepM/ murein hydrolase activator NlpD
LRSAGGQAAAARERGGSPYPDYPRSGGPQADAWRAHPDGRPGDWLADETFVGYSDEPTLVPGATRSDSSDALLTAETQISAVPLVPPDGLAPPGSKAAPGREVPPGRRAVPGKRAAPRGTATSARPAAADQPNRAARRSAASRRRKRSALHNKPVKIAAAVAGTTLIASGVVVATHWSALTQPGHVGQAALDQAGSGPYAGTNVAQADGTATADQVNSKWLEAAAAKRAAAKRAAERRAAARKRAADTQPSSTSAVYRNPLRGVGDLFPERIDMGVDFGGAGPVYALGDGVVLDATADNAGWPGGGWITYQLTDGPASGLVVYVAEDVEPTVQAGQHVTPDTVIGNMFNGDDGIETGWAQSNGLGPESETSQAGDIGGSGPFPTMVGLNFEELLQTTGVPEANNRDDSPSGLLPSNYPTSW